MKYFFTYGYICPVDAPDLEIANMVGVTLDTTTSLITASKIIFNNYALNYQHPKYSANVQPDIQYVTYEKFICKERTFKYKKSLKRNISLFDMDVKINCTEYERFDTDKSNHTNYTFMARLCDAYSTGGNIDTLIQQDEPFYGRTTFKLLHAIKKPVLKVIGGVL